jgi:hypothetical protein
VTESPPVGAGWAVWSKHPGTRDDYSVLACSDGPLSKGEFGQLIAYFAPGNPSAEPGTPGSLPWVTLSRVGVGKEFYLGISVQVGTEDKDHTGRPISRTSYFCVPYAQLMDNPVAYQDLYAAVASPGLLANAGRGIIPLAIPPLDPAALAHAVRDFDPAAVATTAAMLLGGPVTITGPKFPDLATRLRFFDAVAALLPYGYRTYLTAATWSDTGAGDRFRMVFADRARDEASRVHWGTPPRLEGTGPARSYLDYLWRVLRDPDDGRLETLIAYLANDSEPRKFEEPAHAVESMHEFLLPSVVVERIDTGDATLDDIRQLLQTSRVRELPVPRRTQLLKKLIAGADAQDMGLIIQWYDELAGDDTGAMMTDVVIACRSQLWAAGSATLSREYLRFMTWRGMTDELLTRLVARPDPGTDPARGLDAVGRLLTEFVVTSVTGPDSFPGTQRAVEGNAAVAAALLAGLAASRELDSRSLEAAVAWLEPTADRVVRPFVSLFRDAFPGRGSAPEAVSAAAIEDLDHCGEHASVRYLLRAASYRNQLHLVLPGFASWLLAVSVERGRATGNDSRYWRDVAMELTPATMDEAAWLDLALLVTGNEPRVLLAGKYSQPQFSRQLARVWRELTARAGGRGGAAADKVLEDALIAFLGRVPWRTSQAQTEAVLPLVRALIEDAARPRLMTVVLDPLEMLRQMPSGAAPDEIARACARACKAGLSHRQAREALARSGAITSAEQAAAVIEHLHRELAAVGARDESFRWPTEFAAMFAAGDNGQPPVTDFPVLSAVRYSEEMMLRIILLDTVVRRSPPGAPPTIDAKLIKYLEDNRRFLDEVIKEAGKRQSRGGLVSRILGGKGNEEGAPAPAEPGPGVTQAGPDPESASGVPGDPDKRGGQG